MRNHDDKSEVLSTVKQDGMELKDASNELKNDKEVVLAAVKQNGAALQHVSHELKNDMEVVMAAVTQSASALQYASKEMQWEIEMKEYKLETHDEGWCFGLSLVMAYMDSVDKSYWWEGMLEKVIKCGVETKKLKRNHDYGIRQHSLIKVMNEYLTFIQTGNPKNLKDVYDKEIEYKDMPQGTTPFENEMKYTYGKVLERVTSYVRYHHGVKIKYFESSAHGNTLLQPEVRKELYSKSGMNKIASFYSFLDKDTIADLVEKMELCPEKGLGVTVQFRSHTCSIRVKKVKGIIRYDFYDPNDGKTSSRSEKDEFIDLLIDKSRMYTEYTKMDELKDKSGSFLFGIDFFENTDPDPSYTDDQKESKRRAIDEIKEYYEQMDPLNHMDRLNNQNVRELHQIHKDLAPEYFNHSKFKDKEYMLGKIREDRRAAGFAVKELMGDVSFMLEAVKQDGLVLEYASDEVKKDKNVVMEAVKNGVALNKVYEKFRNDKEIVLEAVKQDGAALQFAPAELKNDKEFVKELLDQNGYALYYASSVLKNNKEVVMAAVKQNGLALKYVSKDIEDYNKVVMAAVKQDGLALKHASEVLKNDKEVVMAAVKRNGIALRYASAVLKNNKEVVMEAVKQNGRALKGALKELKGNEDVVLEAVKQDGRALEYASEKIRNDKEIVLEAVKQNGEVLISASSELRGDGEVVLAAVKQNGAALRDASRNIMENREFCKEAVKANPKALEYVLPKFRQDKKFVLEAVKLSPESLPLVVKAVNCINENEEGGPARRTAEGTKELKKSFDLFVKVLDERYKLAKDGNPGYRSKELIKQLSEAAKDLPNNDEIKKVCRSILSSRFLCLTLKKTFQTIINEVKATKIKAAVNRASESKPSQSVDSVSENVDPLGRISAPEKKENWRDFGRTAAASARFFPSVDEQVKKSGVPAVDMRVSKSERAASVDLGEMITNLSHTM